MGLADALAARAAEIDVVGTDRWLSPKADLGEVNVPPALREPLALRKLPQAAVPSHYEPAQTLTTERPRVVAGLVSHRLVRLIGAGRRVRLTWQRGRGA